MINLIKIFLILIFYSTAVAAKPYFSDQIIPMSLLDGPYAIGSKNWQNDIDKIIQSQKNTNKNEIALAEKERDFRVDMLANHVNKAFTAQNNPKLFLLLNRALETVDSSGGAAKDFFKIKRPYLMDKNVKALIKAHSNFSYPSVHTCASYVTANILILLMPEKKAELLSAANKIAQHRVLVGMHYPRDIEGGKKLADLITGALLQNQDFQKDFLVAREELRIIN